MELQKMTFEEKRLYARKILEKNLVKQHIHEKKLKEIQEEFYRFELFDEYQTLQQQYVMADQIKVSNPYFKVNNSYVADTTIIEGKEYISYSAYNYLGFSGDARVNQAAKDAVDRFGTSVSASRIVSGERPIHKELERELARLLGVEDSLVFVSGYGTNVTVIGHLIGPRDLVVHDSLSHNSIVNGCLLSDAKRIPFPHNDIDALEAILKQKRNRYERVLIVIEGVYSMDGDVAPLPEIIDLRNKYKFLLMIDEAHSMGVIGKTGCGIGEYFGVKREDVDIWMGTLSKTFASCGGYIAGIKPLVELLKYTAPGFFFSVGISPQDAAAALASTKLLRQETQRVMRLQENSRLFLTLAKEKGLDTGLSHDSAVIPVIIGNSMRSLKISDALFKKGINVQPIMAPAVPEDASRLRFFITCKHSEDQIRYTVDKVAECVENV